MNNDLVCELICTRLSHDIIGNIGAVANAVELLEEGDMDFIDDIKSILNVSSKTLSARLKFFRLTFGLNNANLENKETVVKTVQDYLDMFEESYEFDDTIKDIVDFIKENFQDILSILPLSRASDILP